MAEMVGMGRWERAVNVVRRVRRNAWVLGGWGWGLVLVCFSGVVMGWCGMVWNGVMVIDRNGNENGGVDRCICMYVPTHQQ